MKKIRIVMRVEKMSFVLLAILLSFSSCDKTERETKKEKVEVVVSNEIVHPMDALSQLELTNII